MRTTHISRQYKYAGGAYLPATDSDVSRFVNAPMERTIYCVQPYHRTRAGLVEGHLRRLLSRDAAIRAARSMRGTAVGVVVYSRTGAWEADFWRDPQLIARAGEVPVEAA